MAFRNGKSKAKANGKVNGKPDSLATAVTEVSERMSVLFREEIALAKAEVAQKLASLTRGAVAVAAGAVFGVFAVIFGMLTLAWGLASLTGHVWVGFAIVFVVLLGMTVGAVVFAVRKLKIGTPPTPTMAIDEAKKIRETVKANGDATAVSTNGQSAPAVKPAVATPAVVTPAAATRPAAESPGPAAETPAMSAETPATTAGS